MRNGVGTVERFPARLVGLLLDSNVPELRKSSTIKPEASNREAFAPREATGSRVVDFSSFLRWPRARRVRWRLSQSVGSDDEAFTTD